MKNFWSQFRVKISKKILEKKLSAISKLSLISISTIILLGKKIWLTFCWLRLQLYFKYLLCHSHISKAGFCSITYLRCSWFFQRDFYIYLSFQKHVCISFKKGKKKRIACLYFRIDIFCPGNNFFIKTRDFLWNGLKYLFSKYQIKHL